MNYSRNVAGKIGVLALQGDVSEHINAFLRAEKEWGLFCEVIPVRHPKDLEGLAGLAIPGGESTTISKLIKENGLFEPICNFKGGIFATCAGMVIAATKTGDTRIISLGLIEMDIERNAFGSQKDSFEADLAIEGLDTPFHAVFIRAPVVKECGKDVKVLSRIKRGIVAVSFGKHIALAFHPELSNDTRIHRIFIENLQLV